MRAYPERVVAVTVLAGAVVVGLLCLGACARPGAGRQGLGVTAEDLQALALGHGIPGFRGVPATRGGTGPLIQVDRARPHGGPISGITAMWRSRDDQDYLRIELWVLASPRDADATARFWVQGCSRPPTPMAAARVGDASWNWDGPHSPDLCIFVLGRAFVVVHLQRVAQAAGARTPAGEGAGAHNAGLHSTADTLARGIEWAIRQRPNLLGKGAADQGLAIAALGRTTAGPRALTLHGVAWAPLSALKLAGAVVTWDQGTNRATATYRGKTVRLSVFQREASVDGRKLDLGAAVLPGSDGPVVPIVKVAAALGMKVTVTPKTLSLG